MTAPIESYAHKTATRLLTTWLRDTAAAAGWDNSARFPGLCSNSIEWRVNRPGPHWGIWQEYPILAGGYGIYTVWDEDSPRWNARPPTYEELIVAGMRPMAVLDIAIQHKGMILYGVEVAHKHRCDPRKVGFLRGYLTLIEIPAYWVLGQIDRPREIPAEFFLT